jgi:hypothetical protein
MCLAAELSPFTQTKLTSTPVTWAATLGCCRLRPTGLVDSRRSSSSTAPAFSRVSLHAQIAGTRGGGGLCVEGHRDRVTLVSAPITSHTQQRASSVPVVPQCTSATAVVLQYYCSTKVQPSHLLCLSQLRFCSSSRAASALALTSTSGRLRNLQQERWGRH